MDAYKEILETFDNLDIGSLLYLHADFIKEWVSQNEIYFCLDDDRDILTNILNETVFYLKRKNNNAFKKPFKNNKLPRHINQIIDRCKNNLSSVKKDLEALTTHGQKTKELLSIIDEFQNNPDIFISRLQKDSESIEKLRACLRKNKLPNENISEYINYFQNITYILPHNYAY